MSEMQSTTPSSLLLLVLRRALLWTSRLGVGELVVPWHVWIWSMKLSEFLQTAYRKVVEWFFRPVFALRIVEPFDEIKNSLVISPASLNRGHNFLHIVLFRLFDVVRLLQHLRGIWRCLVFAGSLGFEQRDMEDFVDLPFQR